MTKSLIACALVLLLGACSTVSTQVVQLVPGTRYAPTKAVDILFSRPDRPHTEIALLESRGAAGTTEVEVLEDIRRKAQEVGADAVVRSESYTVYEQPVPVYDTIYDPFYGFGYHPFNRFRYPFMSPWGYGPPFGQYRLVGGGYAPVVKAVAIKYSDPAAPAKPPAV